jgi:hypothetical protein
MARVSSWGAPGRALGPEEGTGADTGKPAARVEAQAAAAQHGGARRGQRGPGSGERGAGAAPWREERRCGGSWSSAYGRRGQQGRAERKQREGDWR